VHLLDLDNHGMHVLLQYCSLSMLTRAVLLLLLLLLLLVMLPCRTTLRCWLPKASCEKQQ
jgi:hypothetical protein